MDAAHLTKLLDAYLDGGLSAEEKAELEEVLLSSIEARTEFWRRAKLHSALATLAGEDQGEEIAMAGIRDDEPDRIRRQSRWWIPATAAAVLILGIIVFNIFKQGGESVVPRSAQSEIARYGRLFNADWGGAFGTTTGDIIAGPIEERLVSGLAELIFSNGTNVIVQGPAHFTIQDSMHFELHSGTAEFRVPERALGFLVKTPGASMLDLGTRFTAKSLAGKQAELHVIDGAVELKTPGADRTAQLKGGEAMRADADGELSSIPYDPTNLIEEIGRRIRYAAWRDQRCRLLRDNDVLAYFTFEEILRNPREVRNLSSRSGVPARAAAETLLKATPGRWPNHPAVSFAETSDRVEMRIDGLHPQVTFASWVKPGPRPWGDNAIFMGEHNLTGETQWVFDARGRFAFGVRPPGTKPGAEFAKSSRASLDLSDLGEWIHIATTYDADSRQVIHYLNGREAGREKLQIGTPIQFGRATLGNRQRFSKAALAELGLTDAWAERNWSGAIDEFLLMARVLSAAEIQALFAQGRPN